MDYGETDYSYRPRTLKYAFDTRTWEHKRTLSIVRFTPTPFPTYSRARVRMYRNN